jgi:glycosyltransferase involved in cell wall biosynthesis
MAMGVPVVTTDVRGCRELVEEGRTGYRVPAGDVAALTARVDALLRAPELRRALGERARRVVAERFDQEVMLKAQVEALRALLAGRPPRS